MAIRLRIDAHFGPPSTVTNLDTGAEHVIILAADLAELDKCVDGEC